MVFKKDLTPFTKKGSVVKHRGKGASTPRPDPMGQLTGRYPKPAPAPAPDMAPEGPASPFAPPEQMSLPLDDGT